MGHTQMIALMTFLVYINSGSLDATCSTNNKEDSVVNSNNIFPPNIRGSINNKTLTTTTAALKFQKFENTRYINSYTYIGYISIDDCLNECYIDERCNAVSFLHADRNPKFDWFYGNDNCYLHSSLNPATEEDGKEYFTSYIRISFLPTITTTTITITTTTITTTPPISLKFHAFERIRYTGSYKEYEDISVDDCLNYCYTDQKCNAVSFLFAARSPNFVWFDGWDFCFLYSSQNPPTSEDGKQYFTSYSRIELLTTTTTSTTSTTTRTRSPGALNFQTFENTRYISSYTQNNGVSLVDCLNICNTDQSCNAVSFLHADRNPDFSWFKGQNVCYLYSSSNPYTYEIGKEFFTSYIRR
jgi:hypothetical protein